MDLRAILNPADEEPRARSAATGNGDSQSTAVASSSQTTTATKDDDDTITDVSTDNEDDRSFKTPSKHNRHSSDTVPSTVPSTGRHAKQVVIPPIILSPSKGQVYQRRASASPTRVPALPSPPRRRYRIDISHISPPTLENDISRFSIFNALLNYAELTLEVARHLDVEDLVSIYAVSKDFHMVVNARFTAMITAQWHGKAYESGQIFIHRCYRSLCMRDPARRINETIPTELRFVPSFRWLRMVLFREEVVNDIMRSLILEGHRLPKRVTLVIKKIWFTIDISDNARRVGLMHNTKFWANKDLFLATMFFLKLDMRLTHPATGNGELGLRKMLLGQRSLSTLARVLKREEMRTQVEMLAMIVRFNYEPERHRDMSILGVAPDEVGKLQYEGWGARKTKFIGIDELVMREALRRKLNLANHYVDMMIYGYIDKKRWVDIRTRMPAPVEEVESEDESDEDEGPEDERMRLFADDSDEEQGNDGDDENEEMDLDEYNLDSKGGTKHQKLGKGRRSARS